MEKRQRRAGILPDSAALGRVEEVQEQLEVINEGVTTQILRIQGEANIKRAPVYENRRIAIASVPGFWKGVLLGHPWLADIITDQ